MDWRMDDWSFSSRVSPFRYLRINGYLLLPVAFRSLSRLSSALSAKASTLRSFLLDLCRCIALHLSFVSTSFEIVCFLELIKTFVSTFGLLFSDVLIFFKEYLTIELLMFNCINQLSLCMKFSRYIRCFPTASGDGEIRTHDPLLARQVLSQLSYAPIMGLSGLEPPTSRLSGVRSNRLSYKPIFNLATTCFPMPSPA